MKQKNNFNFTASLIMSASLTLLSACGNGGKNNPQPQPVAVVSPFQQCVNCQSINGPLIFTADSSDYSGIAQLHWTFAGQNGVSSTSFAPGSYTGLVASAGSLLISQNLNLGFCVIPAGTYSLATVQAGQWNYGIVNGLILQAISGGLNLMMSFNGQVSSPGYISSEQLSSSVNPVGRMFGNLLVQSVNGQTCQQIIGVQ